MASAEKLLAACVKSRSYLKTAPTRFAGGVWASEPGVSDKGQAV